MDGLNWTIKKSKRTGANYFEEAQAALDPWSLAAVKLAALKLAADGWQPVTDDDAEATGCGPGWLTLTRVVSEEGERRAENYWLFGNVVFLNEERNVALHVEILGGAQDRRRTIADALQGARTVPQGLRWMGGIVPSGPSLRARVSAVEHQLATRYPVVGPGGLGASALFRPNRHTAHEQYENQASAGLRPRAQAPEGNTGAAGNPEPAHGQLAHRAGTARHLSGRWLAGRGAAQLCGQGA